MSAYSPNTSIDLLNPKDVYNLSNNNLFPEQTIPYNEKVSKNGKVTDWGVQCMNYFASFWREGAHRRRMKIINYQLVNGEFNFNEYNANSLSQQFNYDITSLGEAPKDLVHYPICTIPLQSLWGEEVQRPFNFRAKGEDDINRNEYLETKTELLQQYFSQEIQATLSKKFQQSGVDPNSQQGQQMQQAMDPTKIEGYMRKYSTTVEHTANAILSKYIKKLNLKEIFNKGWVDATIVAEEIYWIGTINGESVCERVNPVNIDCDKSYNTTYIDECEKIVRGELMAPSEIIDRYREFLTEQDIKDILSGNVYRNNPSDVPTDFVDYGGFNFLPYPNSDSQRYPLFPGYNVPEYSSNGTNGMNNLTNRFRKHILVLHADWQGKRKIGELSFIGEDGKPQKVYIDGELNLNDPVFKELKDNGATIEYTWINERWQGTRIGDKIHCKIQPNQNQFKSINKLYGAKSGYTGCYYNDINTSPTSVLDQMKSFQELFNIVMEKLKETLRKDKGNLLAFDITQIPSQAGWDFNKFMTFVEKLGMIPLNTSQEGASKNFNQTTILQSSSLNYINAIKDLLLFLKELCNEMVGFTPQRLGNVQATETATATNAAITKSYSQTEHYFRLHNNLKGRVLTNLLEEIKFNLVEGYEDTYFLDDMSIAYLKVDGKFKFADVNVYVGDSQKDLETMQYAKQMLQPALQNGSGLAGAFNLISEESISVIKEKLQAIDDYQAQLKQQEMELKNKELDDRKAMHTEELDRIDTNKQLDRESAERIASDKIIANAELGAKDIDLNDNGIPDAFEVAKLNLDASKLSFEKMKHERELTHTKNLKDKEMGQKTKAENLRTDLLKKQIKSKEDIENKKLLDAEKQRKHDKELEKIKGINQLKAVRARPKPSSKK